MAVYESGVLWLVVERLSAEVVVEVERAWALAQRLRPIRCFFLSFLRDARRDLLRTLMEGF